MATPAPTPKVPARWWRPVGVVVALVLGVMVLRRLDVDRGWAWIDSLGPWAPAAFLGIYALAAAAMVPGSLLSLAAGAKWGVWEGMMYVVIGSNLGANAAFWLGRLLAGGWVSRLVAKRPHFAAVEEAVAVEGWKVVALLRLSPVIPFNMLNYGLSLTRIRWGAYAVATFFGMLPGTAVMVTAGAAVGAAIRPEGRSPLEWGMMAVGLVATVAVTVVLARAARRALDRQLPRDDGRSESTAGVDN